MVLMDHREMKIRVKDVELNTLLTETRLASRSGNTSTTGSTQVRGLEGSSRAASP
jgi:hypothetical protein